MSSDMMLEAAIPVLPVPDITAAQEFYGSRLGFSEAFAYPEYGGVRRDAVEIHFWKCDDPELPKMSSCRVRVAGIEALYREMVESGVVHPNGDLKEKAWGYKEFTISDLWGNIIVIAEAKDRGVS